MAKGRKWLVGALSAAGLLVLAGCGAGEASDSSGGDGRQASGGNGAATVNAVDSDLGRIVADTEGRTLYIFTADRDGSSTCYEECAAAWPPLTVNGSPSGDGLEGSKLGTTQRKDGAQQVTFAGQPLYYYAPDTAPGDTKGQGAQDVWFVTSPSGKPIRTTANSTQPQGGVTSPATGY